MTLLQTAIDYVNPFVQQMYPGARDPWYIEAELTSVDRFILEAIGELYAQGYRVDTIPPRGREPVAIYQQAETDLEVRAVKLRQARNITTGNLDVPAGRVYMAMLDNPPKGQPSTGGDTSAAYARGFNDCRAEVEGLLRTLKPGWG